MCDPCRKDRNKKWRLSNPEKQKETSRRYYEANRARLIAASVAYQRARPGMRLAAVRRHAAKNAAPRVYVITNDAFPGFVKVGKTTINPTNRLGQLNTGDPLKRHRYAALIEVADATDAERQIHATLDRFRVRQDGEWFEVPVEVAVRLAESLRKGSDNETGDK